MSNAGRLLVVGGVLAAVAAVTLSRRRGSTAEEGGDVDKAKDPKKYLKPIIVGEATDPEVAPYMALLATRFITANVHPSIKVFDLVVMSKAPLKDGPDPDNIATRPVAIPPLAYWDNLVNSATLVTKVIETQQLDTSLLRYTGYRPEDYNKAVGGAAGSSHQWASGIDTWLKPGAMTHKNGEMLRMSFARYFVKQPKQPIGFGAYTWDVHFDLAGRRTWNRGAEYAAKAKKELSIA